MTVTRSTYALIHGALAPILKSQPSLWLDEQLVDRLFPAATASSQHVPSATTTINVLLESPTPHPSAATWPIEPLFDVLAYNLTSTIVNQQLPLPPQPQEELAQLRAEPLDAQGAPIQQQIDEMVAAAGKLHAMLQRPDVSPCFLTTPLLALWESVTPPVFRMLCGLQPTAGAILALPPALETCLTSFASPHRPQSASKLSQGARALAKHCHRDESLAFWGVAKGPEQVQNEHAMTVLDKLLAGACWVNTHRLPHDIFVVEVRNRRGYGCRWSIDGKLFRGFLEPQIEGGHDIGWKH
eukprot:TRINITY_DN8635_c0_g1_i1.p1 TRINITY_DN8635_c0_g1~~TRINITY_DN8635_c0_g1_i1.p1  ORF type:complete len:297 (+),score=18.57 TRINITY_DN8635_c0_g1_i1:226-1116(+)